MMRKTLYISALALAMASQTTVAQEKLQRHVVAVPQTTSGSSYLVTWRMLDTDDDYTTFDVIRDGEVVATDINNSTTFRDGKGSKTAQYRIVTKQHGEAVDTTKAVTPWQDVYMQMQLAPLTASSTIHHSTTRPTTVRWPMWMVTDATNCSSNGNPPTPPTIHKEDSQAPPSSTAIGSTTPNPAVSS